MDRKSTRGMYETRTLTDGPSSTETTTAWDGWDHGRVTGRKKISTGDGVIASGSATATRQSKKGWMRRHHGCEMRVGEAISGVQARSLPWVWPWCPGLGLAPCFYAGVCSLQSVLWSGKSTEDAPGARAPGLAGRVAGRGEETRLTRWLSLLSSSVAYPFIRRSVGRSVGLSVGGRRSVRSGYFFT